MKKNLLLGFLVLFLLSATSFAGFAAPKSDSDKPVAPNTRENKLSEEELSRMSKRAETSNLSTPSVSNKEKNDSRNNLKASSQDYGRRHHGYYYGAGVLILVIVLLVVLL